MPVRVISAVVLLLVALWAAWPYGTLWSFGRAVDANDPARIEAAADWPRIRDNLKEDVRARLAAEMGKESDDAGEALARGALMLLGSVVAERLIETYATPEALLVVLREIATAGEGEGRFGDTVDHAFFAGLTEFRVALRPEGADRHSEPLVLFFTFRDFGWKLTRIELPLDERRQAESQRNRGAREQKP